MNGQRDEEYAALRATIRERGTVRVVLFSGAIAVWATLVVVIAGSFAFTSISMTKELGLGVAFAILFDALFVRMMLVPASTRLLGRRAWWIPPWLDRVLPRLHFE